MSRIKQQFKLLHSIAPDASRKENFRRILQSKVALESRALPTHGIMMRMTRSMRTAPALALALIITLVGSGSGVSYAAQNAIPGETLYPVKLATERARIAVTPTTKAKAELHLEFASRRLHEVERLITENAQPQINVSDVLAHYKSEFNESELLATKNPSLAQDIAPIIGETTESHRRILTMIAEKAHERFDGDFDDELDEAYEHAESKDDAVLYAALSATSTPSAIMPPMIVEKSRKKWEAIEQEVKKIERNRRPLPPRAANASAQVPLPAPTDAALDSARITVDDARTKWEKGEYREALDTSIKARALIKEAEKEGEKKRREDMRERAREETRGEDIRPKQEIQMRELREDDRED